ncbi:chemotaxis response regulator protein-glutamate methylesterase [Thalassobacillus sp. CUG 92003]|uniref:protein-glutamate methylesterase/protein-glutamine glutaminase n=1 Tax=Thalassobacillus sp. CUG 92003 TaxID=2736641 RepID=UPI0015E64476|nr:chemotaxis response regulator protein-glutamate methylesterase [Thalassobacillus sp. CUG 92003]
MTIIKVLVVDDSAFMRKMITEILDRDPRPSIVGIARNGQDGLLKAKELQPDVITLDIEMPIMDGLTALKALMVTQSAAVVMLSSLTQQGAHSTIQALALGAVDFVGKPSGAISLDIQAISHDLKRKVTAAGQANIRQPEGLPAGNASEITYVKDFPAGSGKAPRLLVIGASTGGPRALLHLLQSLPSSFPIPIVIVQHMPAGFTQSLAHRLNNHSHLHVKEAEEGEQLEKGVVYVAPGNKHVAISKVKEGYGVELSDDEPVIGHRPSMTFLLQSLVNHPELHIITVILTGMGADGTEGLLQLHKHEAKVYVLAESQETAVIYGMPKAVVKAKLANEIVPLYEMGQRIVSMVNREGRV